MLAEYLKNVSSIMHGSVPEGFKYASLYHYFLETGLTPPAKPVDTKTRRLVWSRIQPLRPQMRECFYNAQQLVLRYPKEFTYWEGYAVRMPVPFPVHHAWTTFQGFLVDPTFRLDIDKRCSINNIVIGQAPEGWEYFGRAYGVKQVEDRWLTGFAGSLVDNPAQDFPILRACSTSRKSK